MFAAMSESRIPAAFARQMLNASSRWNDGSSSGSWVDLEGDGHRQEEPASTMPTVPENDVPTQADPAPQGASSSDVPPPPPTVFPPSAPAAPVLQAAHSFVDHAHDTPASRRLRRQQEQAARRGRRAFRSGNMGNLAHNPLNSQLPDQNFHRLVQQRVSAPS